jgi:hypothetical protein
MEPRLVWGTFLVILIAGAGPWLWGSEAGFRWIGLALQLLGVGTVVVNIRGTRAQFGQPSILARTATWWRQRPRFRSRLVIVPGAGSLSFSSGRAGVDIWHDLDPNAASVIEARLDAAEKNLIWLRDRLNENAGDTERKLQQQTNALEQEKRDRASNDDTIRTTLKTAQTGGLHVSMMGVCWLFVGIVMSTVPNELACLANRLFP